MNAPVLAPLVDWREQPDAGCGSAALPRVRTTPQSLGSPQAYNLVHSTSAVSQTP